MASWLHFESSGLGLHHVLGYTWANMASSLHFALHLQVFDYSTSWATLEQTWHPGYNLHLQVLGYITSWDALELSTWHLGYTLNLHVLGYMASYLHFASSDLGLITSWASFTWANLASWLHFPSSCHHYTLINDRVLWEELNNTLILQHACTWHYMYYMCTILKLVLQLYDTCWWHPCWQCITYLQSCWHVSTCHTNMTGYYV